MSAPQHTHLGNTHTNKKIKMESNQERYSALASVLHTHSNIKVFLHIYHTHVQDTGRDK